MLKNTIATKSGNDTLTFTAAPSDAEIEKATGSENNAGIVDGVDRSSAYDYMGCFELDSYEMVELAKRGLMNPTTPTVRRA